ncbi:MAG: response regulator [Leptospiraceae bacterium]|nr:response regulator [Leptospiraceae bacterium]
MHPRFEGRVLIVEDEPAIADTLTIALDLEGFKTEVATTGDAGLSSLAASSDAFVILDIGLPDQTGFEVLRSIRQDFSVPVLILTARTEEIDRILGLELGADDYVTKPFSPREVVSRVKAILRRWTNASDSDARSANDSIRASGTGISATDLSAAYSDTSGQQSGDFRWNDAEKSIYFREHRLALSPYEFGTLRLLLSRPGMVFSREMIMDQVWTEPEDSFDRAVDTVIKNIRSALRKAGAADAIETRRGLGYCIRKQGG